MELKDSVLLGLFRQSLKNSAIRPPTQPLISFFFFRFLTRKKKGYSPETKIKRPPNSKMGGDVFIFLRQMHYTGNTESTLILFPLHLLLTFLFYFFQLVSFFSFI